MSRALKIVYRGEAIVESADEKLVRAAVSLNARILGLSFGVIGGLGLFVATIWLVIKGGRPLGPNLSLLGQYLPGYTVSLPGSFIGLFYGLILGYVGGWLVGWIYNGIVFLRSR